MKKGNKSKTATLHQKTEGTLHDSEENLRNAYHYTRSLIEASLDPLVTINAEGKITDVNLATEKATGFPRNTLIGTDFSDYFTEPEKARIGFQKTFENGSVIDYPLSIRHTSNKIIDVIYNANVYRNEQGKVLGVFAAARDITERNRVKEKRASELIIANKELVFQNEEKQKRANELVIANKELAFQNEEKEERANELIIANKELAFQNEEKQKRADELIIANNEKDKRVAELIIANEEKEKRANELINVNKELETFSYSVSHDLRSPLRHINGYVDLLLSRFYDSLPDKARHYLDNIADSSRQMGTLIDDLLQFSRIGRQEKQLVNFDMNIVVLEVLESIKKDNPERNIEWCIAKLPQVYGDQALLHIVWKNLFGNAVKFTRTREKAIIEINVLNESDAFIFSIHDNGVGFDMQYAQKLFGVFQRLHPIDEFEGTGIGLANVQHIILRHGGRTWAEAEPDKGATFYFSLPKNKED